MPPRSVHPTLASFKGLLDGGNKSKKTEDGLLNYERVLRAQEMRPDGTRIPLFHSAEPTASDPDPDLEMLRGRFLGLKSSICHKLEVDSDDDEVQGDRKSVV